MFTAVILSQARSAESKDPYRMKKLWFLLFTTACFAQSADWATPAERSNYRTTPRYDETMAYVRRVAAATPGQVKVFTFGQTGEGRDLVAVAVSRDGVFDPQALHAAGRPIVLIQNAIHAGEMDGKDSCLALLRDMGVTKTRAGLLERAVVLIIPIYNPDGHERFGPFNRINQNGPEEMGYRVDAENLNLNRDYMKADAPETKAWLRLWNEWLPDFFVDDHVTDGADYQYDVTYNLTDAPGQDPAIASWLETTVAPYLENTVQDAGHLAAPYIDLVDGHDPTKGLNRFPGSPRFADGYVLLQNRPGLLVEMHMLKDYKTRVTGNYEILRALLQLINREADRLVKMNREADAAVIAAGKSPGHHFILRSQASKETVPFFYRGYKFTTTPSEVSGQPWIQYTQEPMNIEIPRPARLEPTYSVEIPRAYIIPREWDHVIEVLQLQGVRMLHTTAPWTGEVQTYRCHDLKWRTRPFEGRHPLFNSEFGSGEFGGECAMVREKLSFAAGSVVVPMDQRSAKVAIEWLEPQAPDSAVVWNFFDPVFEQKEYAEDYVLEKLARDMMAKDPALKQEFENRLAGDKAFAANPRARLEFFYRHSPWYEVQRVGLYPVGRLTTLDGVPVR
ncbi:MAG TPA: M14 family metallopeptidase [Terriglobales bacterium]|nr:M14 family metallopeptidase [Terriglobales bacterium]